MKNLYAEAVKSGEWVSEDARKDVRWINSDPLERDAFGQRRRGPEVKGKASKDLMKSHEHGQTQFKDFEL